MNLSRQKEMQYLSRISIISTTCTGCAKTSLKITDKKLCTDCYNKLKKASPPYCKRCGFTSDGILEICTRCQQYPNYTWSNAITLFEMTGHGKKLIHSFKYQNGIQLTPAFAEMAKKRLTEEKINFDITTAIPLHWIKHLKRGYNQSELLSQRIADQLKIEHKQLLRRQLNTKPQAHLNQKQRETNLLNAFCIKRGANCQNRSILLVDDVITTGATLAEATKVLLNAGAHDVTILAIARR